MNWIYRHIYFLLLKTPGRETAGDSASLFVGAFVGMHMLVLTYTYKRIYDLDLSMFLGKTSIVIFAIICMAVSFIYYDGLGKGKVIVERTEASGNIPNPIIGSLVFLEAVALPIWAIPLLLWLTQK
jgi:hypothetical protein